MAQDKGFSLISVSADEEDDVVIQAGVAPAPAAGRFQPDDLDERLEDGFDSKAQAGEEGRTSSILDEAADEEARAEYLRHMRARERKRASNAMITTEEDLHAKMPFANMQRIILVAFLLLVLVAVVYWLFLRPLA